MASGGEADVRSVIGTATPAGGAEAAIARVMKGAGTNEDVDGEAMIETQAKAVAVAAVVRVTTDADEKSADEAVAAAEAVNITF